MAMAEDRPRGVGPASKPWALQTFQIVSGLIAALILLQALLAGEWLIGKNVIRVHETVGIVVVVLAVIDLLMVAAAGLRGSLRTAALGMTALFLLLVIVQLVLGFGGFDNANQARALHIANGVLLFGLAGGNAALARRAAREG